MSNVTPIPVPMPIPVPVANHYAMDPEERRGPVVDVIVLTLDVENSDSTVLLVHADGVREDHPWKFYTALDALDAIHWFDANNVEEAAPEESELVRGAITAHVASHPEFWPAEFIDRGDPIGAAGTPEGESR